MKIMNLRYLSLTLTAWLRCSGVAALRSSTIEERHYGEGRIIGGSPVEGEDYSFTVAMQHNGYLCGGSLIAKDVVLTAAHCYGPQWNVVIGRHDLNGTDGEVITMKEQVPHPQYSDDPDNNDFMLVFLDRATTQDVALVTLNNDASYPDVGDLATVVGWGDTDPLHKVQTTSDHLLEVEVAVISNTECDASSGLDHRGDAADYHGQITEDMLCAEADLSDSCQGDSGGPLLLRKGRGMVQIGVVSWGIGCANQHFPGVYARVNRAYEWIEEEACKGSQYAAEAGFNCPDANGPLPPSSDDGCSGSEVPLAVDVVTDDFPHEISWMLTDDAGNIVASAAEGSLDVSNKAYANAYCVPPARYTFTIHDFGSDGICCSYGSGSYKISYDSTVVAQGGSFRDSESASFGPSTSPAPKSIELSQG